MTFSEMTFSASLPLYPRQIVHHKERENPAPRQIVHHKERENPARYCSARSPLWLSSMASKMYQVSSDSQETLKASLARLTSKWPRIGEEKPSPTSL
ncbi:hypothetical protein ACH5RR_020850 [Cinchona calisaya]|uniref:Uncharacterized protein n=1 Tax=Cinchona calisaya TaxID=153742 RepID=A0ABD2ZHG5_9GENT